MFLPFFVPYRPYRFGHVHALCINLSYLPKDQSLHFWENILRIGRAGKWHFVLFLFFLFLVIYFVSHFFFFFSMKITMAFIWGSIYLCTMDGFFRILKKALSELICTQLYVLGNKEIVLFDWNNQCFYHQVSLYHKPSPVGLLCDRNNNQHNGLNFFIKKHCLICALIAPL